MSEHKPARAARGRPRTDEPTLQQKRRPVLMAAGALVADKPSSAITVEDLVNATGVSRPTLYRWFPGGAEEVVRQLIQHTNDELIEVLTQEVAAHGSLEQRLERTLRAYFQWCQQKGAVISGLYREGFDETSLACQLRQQTHQAISGLIQHVCRESGLTELPDITVATLIAWVESAGAILSKQQPADDSQTESQLMLTLTMAKAVLHLQQAITDNSKGN